MNATNEVVKTFVKEVEKGFIAFLNRNNVDKKKLDIDECCRILQEEATKGMTEGLADAKEAFLAGMTHIASATLAASARLAGIRTGQRVTGLVAE